jgi:predicted transcriptional regulator
MEVRFTPEQEARLSEIASHAGIDPERLLKDARFRAAVQKGLEQADRGEFVDEDEMQARIDRMLQS